MPPRVLSTGLLAGLLMNVFGWLGNQLWLGKEWDAAIAGSAFAASRQRTLWNEVGSLAPDFVYGIALAWLCWICAKALGSSRGVSYAAAGMLWLVSIATPLLGTANASLVPWRVTLLTLLLAFVIMIPVTELVWRRIVRSPLVHLAALITIALSAAAGAQTAPRAVTFAEHDELTVVSAELGETRPIWVRAPALCRAGAATACDVLLVLDADALFPLAVAYAHVMEGMGRMSPIIIVGIPSLTMDERYRNFAEGGPRFLRFLEREVMPAVESAYQPSARRTLAGHSLAGLFAVDAITAGASFESYIAISPSISLNRQAAIERILPVLDRKTGDARRLYVSVANDGPPYVDAFTRLYQEYDKRKPAWLTTSFQRFRMEDHVTTIAPALNAAMNWLYLQRTP